MDKNFDERSTAGASARHEADRRWAADWRAAGGQWVVQGSLFRRLVNTLRRRPQDRLWQTNCSGPSSSTRNWYVGAEGEELVGGLLDQFAATEAAMVLDDRRVPGSATANFDHIVMAPKGVFLIDTKNYSGRVEVWKSNLYVAGRDRGDLLQGVHWQVDQFCRALTPDPGPIIPLYPVVCFVRGVTFPREALVEGVVVASPVQVRELLSGTGPLSRQMAESMHERADRSFPPAIDRIGRSN